VPWRVSSRRGQWGRIACLPPLVVDNWERAKLIPLSAVKRVPDGRNSTFPNAGERFQNRIPGLWKANKPGETLTLRFKGLAADL